jgi:capsular exopolysaccharide synthesis family protein
MGRIAEALKRAEEERQRALETAPVEDAAAGVPVEPSTPATAGQPGPGSGLEETPDEPISVVQGLSDSLIPFFERSSLVTEQYRSLRTRLLSQNPDYEHRLLAVTSAIPKEGKSVTALNLSCTLAEIRHLKVLVVDGDFRRSSLAFMLDQPDQPGLAEILRGQVTVGEALRHTPIPNLMFIPAGNKEQHSAAELLAATSAHPAFKQMQHDFHYTIVDTPPATTVTDVGIIGQMCTGVIVVVRLHRTAEVAAKRAVRLLQVNNIPIVGCLIVGRDLPPGRYYGYDYGYAYHYYRSQDYYKESPRLSD